MNKFWQWMKDNKYGDIEHFVTFHHNEKKAHQSGLHLKC